MISLRKSLLLILSALAINSFAQDSTAFPQKDFVDVLQETFHFQFSDKKVANDDRKVVYSLLPMVNSQGDQSGIVISINSTFYLGDPKTTNMSSVNFVPYVSYSRQAVLPIRSYLYTKDNLYSFMGDYRFMRYPQMTYGLGSHSQTQAQSTLYYNQWRFYQFATRALSTNFRIGGGVQMDQYYNLVEISKISSPTDYALYSGNDSTKNQRSFGLTLQLLYDSRKNTINPQQGYYGEVDFRFNTRYIGSNSDWSSMYVDLRKYFSLSTHGQKVFATRVFYWSILGGSASYLDLPSIGWDTYGRTGRGFTKNRFRSNALLYFESEYRTDLTKNGLLGAVFFSNISSVSKLNTQQFANWHPAVGAGIRVKWRKEDLSNMSLDIGKSLNDWSLRIGLTENF